MFDRLVEEIQINLQIMTKMGKCLLVPFVDNLCKQFGPRSGPTKCLAWSGSKQFDTLMAFLKINFRNPDQPANNHQCGKTSLTLLVPTGVIC